MRKFNAFTLAEVLITLAIIGVVAAMTIPTLITKYDEYVTVVKVKKFYSMFSQAYQLAIVEHGSIDNWGLTNSTQEEDEDDGEMYHTDASYENYDKFYQIMSPYLKNVVYKKMHKVAIADKTEEPSGGWFFADGILLAGMWLEPEDCTNYCGDFYISTNGKAMNRPGTREYTERVFNFVITKNGIIPAGNSGPSFQAHCLSKTNLSRCTGWIITNGNMDYLHCDDLSWTGKRKCSD